jgi:undecaprenyl-diphosphatase
MEAMNHALFLWINAKPDMSQAMYLWAVFCAKWMIFVIAFLPLIAWFARGETVRKTMLIAIVATCIALILSYVVGQIYFHPRPFMVPLGTNFLYHAADSSLPSDHLTVWYSVCFGLLLQRPQWQPWAKKSLMLLILMGLCVAWARVYLGVHFPFDMLAAASLSWIAAWLAVRTAPYYSDALYALVLRIYRSLAAPLIRRGWLLP